MFSNAKKTRDILNLLADKLPSDLNEPLNKVINDYLKTQNMTTVPPPNRSHPNMSSIINAEF